LTKKGGNKTMETIIQQSRAELNKLKKEAEDLETVMPE
jgi:hypothetical protein